MVDPSNRILSVLYDLLIMGGETSPERPQPEDVRGATAVGANDSSEQVAVSVVVPVHNAGTFLARQMDALERQTFNGTWEVVLVDNGSTDGCLTAAMGSPSTLSRRVVPAADSQGPSYARNVGARSATGKWLAFCDADDEVAPNWLEQLHRSRNDYDLVTGAIELARLNPPEILLARGTAQTESRLPSGPCQFLSYALSCNLFVLRSTFLGLGGFDEALPYDEDVDFSWRAQLAGLTLGLAPDAVVHYRYRTSVGGVYRQMRNYGVVEALLFRRYRRHGAQRLPWTQTARTLLWLLSRSPFMVMGLNRRYVWFKNLGGEVGRLQGSIRYRVWYP